MSKIAPFVVSIWLVSLVLVSCNQKKNRDDAYQGLELEESPVYDAGEFIQNTEKSHRFSFTNAAAETILITRVETSCTCSRYSLSTQEIAPGGRFDLDVTVNALDRVGSFASNFFIYWRKNGHKDAETIRVEVRGKAKRIALISPQHVDFGKVPVDSASGEREISVGYDATTADWSNFSATSNRFPISTQKTPEGFLIRVKAVGETKFIGRVKDVISLRLFGDQPNVHFDVDVPVSAHLVGPVNVTPSSVYLKKVTSRISGSVLLNCSDGSRVEPVSFRETRLPSMVLNFERISDHAFKMSYDFSPDGVRGIYSQNIEIPINVNDERFEVQIPFFAFVEKS